MNKDKSLIIAFSCGLALIILIGTFFLFNELVYPEYKADKFCRDKGYRIQIINNRVEKPMEKGYIKCCNPIYVDHARTEDQDCQTFKYKGEW